MGGGEYLECVKEAHRLYVGKILPPIKKTHEDVRSFVSKLLDCLGINLDIQSHEARVERGKADILVPGRFVVEVKTDLSREDQRSEGVEQLAKYMIGSGVVRGVLTDGRVWEFYEAISGSKPILYSRVELPPDLRDFYEELVNGIVPSIGRRSTVSPPSASNIDEILSKLGTESHLFRTVRSTLASLLSRGTPRLTNLIGLWTRIYKRLYPGLGDVAKSLGRMVKNDDKSIDDTLKNSYESLANRLGLTNSDEAIGYIDIIIRHMYYDLLLRIIVTHVLTPEKSKALTSASKLLDLWEKSTELTFIFHYNTIYMELWRDLVRWSKKDDRIAADSIIRRINSVVSNYDWTKAEPDVFRELYENLLPSSLRHQIGEYYTPDSTIALTLDLVESAFVDSGEDPSWLDRSVIDPACGSGGFLVAVLDRKLGELAERLKAAEGSEPKTILKKLSEILNTMLCFDINPIAVTTARLLAFLRLLRFTQDQKLGIIPIIEPRVYLADSLAPAAVSDDGSHILYYDGEIAVLLPSILDGFNHKTYLDFVSKLSGLAASMFKPETQTKAKLVEIADKVREVLQDLEPYHVDSSAISELTQNLGEAYGELSRILQAELKKQARQQPRRQNMAEWRYALWTILLNLHNIRKYGDSIWGTLVGSIVLPLANRGRFDVVVGNPPWLRYNMAGRLQDIYRAVWSRHQVAPRRHLRTSFDLAVIFYIISAESYLKDSGVIAFVMPRSVIDGQQHYNFLKRLVKGGLDNLRAYAILELDIDPTTKQQLRKTFKHGLPAIVLVSTKTLKPKTTYYLYIPHNQPGQPKAIG